jgi:hypothetical protein
MSDFTERILPSDPASSKQQSTERIIAKSLIVSRSVTGSRLVFTYDRSYSPLIWRYQGNAPIEVSGLICVFGKLPNNRQIGQVIAASRPVAGFPKRTGADPVSARSPICRNHGELSRLSSAARLCPPLANFGCSRRLVEKIGTPNPGPGYSTPRPIICHMSTIVSCRTTCK